MNVHLPVIIVLQHMVHVILFLVLVEQWLTLQTVQQIQLKQTLHLMVDYCVVHQ